MSELWGPGTHQEAVDEIDRLTALCAKFRAAFEDAHAENIRLRAALERIADLYGYEAEANAVAIARAALNEETK